MILIITNKDDITVDLIIRLLKNDRCEYYRFNTEELFDSVEVRFRIDEGKYYLYDQIKQKIIDLDKVSSVYYRRPGIPKLKKLTGVEKEERMYLTREALSVLDGIYKHLEDCFWINNVFRIREAENKLYQLEIAKQIGFMLPKTILSNNADFIQKNMDEISRKDFVTKAIHSGNINPSVSDRIIFTSDITRNEINSDNVSSFAAYIQEKIDKKSDLRCIVVGETVFSAEILSQSNEEGKTDWRKSSVLLPHRNYALPDDLKNKCIYITKRLGLVYSAIDFAIDRNNNYIFLECNPNGQWGWIENRIHVPIDQTIEELLKNA